MLPNLVRRNHAAMTIPRSYAMTYAATLRPGKFLRTAAETVTAALELAALALTIT